MTGLRWEEPERSPPIPTDEGHSPQNPEPLNERNGDFTNSLQRLGFISDMTYHVMRWTLRCNLNTNKGW